MPVRIRPGGITHMTMLDQCAKAIWPFVSGGMLEEADVGYSQDAVVTLAFTDDHGQRVTYSFDASTFELTLSGGAADRVALTAVGYGEVRREPSP